MKKWQEFYDTRILAEADIGDLIVKGFHAMSPTDQEKVNKVLSSKTYADMWSNAVQTALAGKQNLTPQQIAAEMLNGIDAYLGSRASVNSQKSDRIQTAATQRQVPGATVAPEPEGPRMTYAGRFGKNTGEQGEFAAGVGTQGKKGEVPKEIIDREQLYKHPSSVWSGPYEKIPTYAKYYWNRRDNKFTYNPQYSG